MVAAIREATARVLVAHGFERTTTNRVAEAAGVSVGSLYQYFPSKDALVAAVAEQHIEEMLALVARGIDDTRALPLAQAARALIELLVAAHAVDPALHRVLAEQVPRTGGLGRLADFERQMHRTLVSALAARRAEIAVADLDLAAFLLVSAVEAATHSAVLYQPARLRDPAFLDALTDLVVGYLSRPGPDRRRRSGPARRRTPPAR